VSKSRTLRGLLPAVLALVAVPVTAQSIPPVGLLTLDGAIAEALASGPRLREPNDGRTLARIREAQARARFGLQVAPAFDTTSDPTGLAQRTAGVTVSRQLRTGAQLRFDANTYQFRGAAEPFRDSGYTIRVSQPLFRGWTAAASSDLMDAQRGIAAADRSYADARQELIFAVAAGYFEVLRARRTVEAAERAVERSDHLRRSSQARAGVGLATELDVLRADLLAAEADAVVLSQREAFQTAADALNTVVGRPADAPVEVAAIDFGSQAFAPPDETLDELVRKALAFRPDVQEARDRISDATRRERVARWNLLPPLMLDVSYTRRGLGSGGDNPWSTLFKGFRWGVSSSYALNRADARAASATAALARRRSELEMEEVERRVSDDVRRAHRAWDRSGSMLRIREAAVALAERQLRLAQLRFERGVGSSFDVVDAEAGLFDAETGVIDAEVARALAALALRRVTGTLHPEAFRP
jgi:outer membrane protein TolC